MCAFVKNLENKYKQLKNKNYGTVYTRLEKQK
jgi:hypothetical protein